MLTFAYGSNMDCGQMKDRCPSVSFVCVAVLRDYRLCFPRKSKKRDCGVAGVERGEGCNVWGVVYEINEADVGNLDATEGYRNKMNVADLIQSRILPTQTCISGSNATSTRTILTTTPYTRGYTSPARRQTRLIPMLYTNNRLWRARGIGIYLLNTSARSNR